jgi:hypothetical protein
VFALGPKHRATVLTNDLVSFSNLVSTLAASSVGSPTPRPDPPGAILRFCKSGSRLTGPPTREVLWTTYWKKY